MRRIAAFCCAVLLTSVCFAKDVKIRGFVTTVSSPSNFEIDDYRITRDTTLVLDIDKDEAGTATASFNPEDIRVGTELEIKGEYDEKTSELRAKSIKVFFEDTRKIKRTAMLAKAPALQKNEAGWSGELFADGQRIVVDPTSAVTIKRNKEEKKEAKAQKAETPDFVPLAKEDVLNLDTFVHYEGVRQRDGSILAAKVEFQHAELEKGEAKMWERLFPKVKEPDFMSFKPGELKVDRAKYKLVASKEAQDYISKLGESLIPAHQKELASGSPLKVPFKFYLVDDKSFNASAYPNGVVIVHSGVFDMLENEAQLAFVLSHEITHSVEKHVWREHEYHKKARMALVIGGAVGAGFGGKAVADLANMVEAGIRNGYARSLENQADREGVQHMIELGYDPREAPRTWKVVSLKHGDRPTNIFWDSHDNNTTRRSYLMAELKNNYSDTDFATLKKDSDDFHKVAELVKAASHSKKKVKVKVK